MDIISIVFVLALLFLCVKIIQPLCRNYSIPYPSLLLVIGYLSSELITYLGYDTGLRWDNFNFIVNYVLLPVLIFEMAFSLNASCFFRKIIPIIVLAFPFMLISIVIISSILFFSIDHPGFPLVAAIIAATMLSTSDPVSINALTNQSQASNGLLSLLKGESLFNGIVVAVLLTIAIELVNFERSIESVSFFEAYVIFIKLFSGGVFTGFICGFIGLIILKNTNIKSFNAIVSLIVASSTFLLAKLVLDVSGILAVLVAGLMFNAQAQHKSVETKQFLVEFWNFNSNITRTFLYLMLGVSVYLPFLKDQWIAVLIGIGATLFARAILIFVCFGPIGSLSQNFYLPLKEQVPLFWGSIKGAIVIALVLSLPSSLPYAHTIQAIVYGMVIFSLLVQAPILKVMLARLKQH